MFVRTAAQSSCQGYDVGASIAIRAAGSLKGRLSPATVRFLFVQFPVVTCAKVIASLLVRIVLPLLPRRACGPTEQRPT